MNQLDATKRAQVLGAICRRQFNPFGHSALFGVGKNTVARLLLSAGRACAGWPDKALRNLNCKRLQCDEIWSFCYAKDRTARRTKG